MGIRDTAAEVFRDHVTVGVPSSGRHEPVKGDIRALFGVIEDSIGPTTATAALLGVVTGVVSPAQAATNAALINAWLAGADGRIFDWGFDEIEIATTVRSGRHGNDIRGIAGHNIFTETSGGVTGAVARWRGAAGGVMFDIRKTGDDVDLRNPGIFGLCIDGNGLADFGILFQGLMLPRAGEVHVCNMRQLSSAYAYVMSSNPFHSAGQINCVYGGQFGRMTAFVRGAANGFLLTGRASTSGENVTFCSFVYMHVTCENGFAYVFQKGDDINILQGAMSRLAGGTGGQLLFNTNGAALQNWVGNKILNFNLGKQDGPATQIVFNDNRTKGNEICFNGVDYTPVFSFNGGSQITDNKISFLGQSNYAGGYTVQPFEVMSSLRLANVEVTDPATVDYYLEGSSTPTLLIGGSSTGITYGSRFVTWTRIGNRVVGECSITLTSKGGLSGALQIDSLPFAPSSATAFSIRPIGGFTAGVIDRPLGATHSGGSIIPLKTAAGASGMDFLTGADITNAASFVVAFNYQV
jgi:hypothetical protein